MSATTRDAPTTLAEAIDSLPMPEASTALREIATRISKEFFRIVPAEDLYQEFFAWLGQHPARANQWHFVGSDDQEMFGWKSFRRDAAGIMATAARREKRHVMGQDETDEMFYGKAQVQELLIYVWHGSTLIAEAGPEVRTSEAKDPAMGGGKAAAIADVREAYSKVIRKGSRWETILQAVYAVGATHQEVAEKLEVSRVTITKAHGRAIEAILQQLNGTVPFREGPGSRKAISNAQAINRTNHQED